MPGGPLRGPTGHTPLSTSVSQHVVPGAPQGSHLPLHSDFATPVLGAGRSAPWSLVFPPGVAQDAGPPPPMESVFPPVSPSNAGDPSAYLPAAGRTNDVLEVPAAPQVNAREIYEQLAEHSGLLDQQDRAVRDLMQHMSVVAQALTEEQRRTRQLEDLMRIVQSDLKTVNLEVEESLHWREKPSQKVDEDAAKGKETKVVKDVSQILDKELSEMRRDIEQRLSQFGEFLLKTQRETQACCCDLGSVQEDLRKLEQRHVLQIVSAGKFCLNSLGLSEQERTDSLRQLEQEERRLHAAMVQQERRIRDRSRDPSLSPRKGDGADRDKLTGKDRSPRKGDSAGVHKLMAKADPGAALSQGAIWSEAQEAPVGEGIGGVDKAGNRQPNSRSGAKNGTLSSALASPTLALRRFGRNFLV